MGKTIEIDHSTLNEKEKNALISIESRRITGEPTAEEVIATQFGGDARAYLKAMGEIE